MPLVAYLFSFLCALPCVVFALGILALDHVIATRNVLKILYHFLLAFGWGLPVLSLVVVALIAAGFFPQGRLVGSVVLLALNVGALVVIVMSQAAPKSASECVFFLPAVVSGLLAGWLIATHARPRVPVAPPPVTAARLSPE